jgi:tetratricopeptide (TPR) repeat protein
VGNVCAQSPAAYERAGDKALERGDYYSASSYFYSAYVSDATNKEVMYKLADACRLFNDYENAQRYYNKLYAIDKQNEFPLTIFYLAEMNQRQGYYDEAKKIYMNYVRLHENDSDYFSLKAKREIFNCDHAQIILKDTVKIDVENLGTIINSVYSDFAAQQIDSSGLLYSSLRFENKNKKTAKRNKYISKILHSENENKNWSRPLPLDSAINKDGLHACNGAVSSNNTFMVYTQCNQQKDKLMCSLYMSYFKNGGWTTAVRLNDSINLKGFTATQPCIANNGIEGYILYFVSDRPGGYGKLDIWKSTVTPDFIFSNPLNLGNKINTMEDDITPFFDNLNQLLYFSSEGHNGLGGFDIYKTAMENNTFGNVMNVGYPINTSYNDIYFTVASPNKILLSSNRLGSLYIKARTCCYDIYEGVYKDTVSRKDTKDTLLAIIPNPIDLINDTTVLGAIKNMQPILPLKLYFENDRPNPRSMQTTTTESYVTLYTDYISNRNDYILNYAAVLKDASEKTKAELEVNYFFDTIVQRSYQDLDRFTSILLQQLNAGNQIEIVMRGSASPLANSNYNKNLSKRRINSVVNFWKSYGNGKLVGFIKSGRLKIIEEAAGETLASKNVSDDINDKRNSVFSPGASSLRYIEVIKVRLNGLQIE